MPGLAQALLFWALHASLGPAARGATVGSNGTAPGPASSTSSNGSTSTSGSTSSGSGSGGGGGVSSGVSAEAGLPTVEFYEVVQEFPHDPDAFTEGLEFGRNCSAPGNCQDYFWESTGMPGKSQLRQVALTTGQTLRSHTLPPADFGEGVVRFKDKLLQLTYQGNKTWLYEVADLNRVSAAATPLGDGWGITLDGDGVSAIVSNGTAALTWLNATDLTFKKAITVRDGGQEVPYLNELEWVEGEVYANVWQTECIARIDPATGAVKGWVAMQGLRSSLLQLSSGQRDALDVLNGIAYDAGGRRLFVTGKYWPRLFQVRTKPTGLAAAEAASRARASCIVTPIPLPQGGRRLR